MNPNDLKEIDEFVNELRCDVCKKYLINPPLILLLGGTIACGNCCPPSAIKNPDGSLVRVTVLENALRKLSFPCKYQSTGCEDRIFFDFLTHNEEECACRPLSCPIEDCEWSGSTFSMQNHFEQSHYQMVKNSLEFKLKVGQFFEGTILAVVDRNPFLLRYHYTGQELIYRISSLTMIKASYNIWIVNQDDEDLVVSTKRNACHPHITGRFDEEKINLVKYLPLLENPRYLRVAMKVITDKSAGSAEALKIIESLMEGAFLPPSKRIGYDGPI